jgi:hypothetical protein
MVRTTVHPLVSERLASKPSSCSLPEIFANFASAKGDAKLAFCTVDIVDFFALD